MPRLQFEKQMYRLIAAILLLCTLVLGWPGEGPDIGGLWYGRFRPNGRPTEVSLLLQTRGDAWAGALLLGDSRNIPLKEVAIHNDAITFSLDLRQVTATFKGAFAADHTELRGEFTQQ